MRKYIYALADFAVVVSSDYQEGGTWAGADEELRRESGRPVFVRTGAGVPRGNTELLRKGAKPFPADALTAGLKDALNAAICLKEGVIEERTIRKIKKLAMRKPDEELKLS